MSHDDVQPVPSEQMEATRQEIHEHADDVWTGGGKRTPRIGHAERLEMSGSGGRVAIVDGCRTPFVKAGEQFRSMDVLDLASVPAAELIRRQAIDPSSIDRKSVV